MKANILVVDDEKSIRESLTGVLTDEGYKVSTVVEGEGALGKVKSDSIDMVLLDIWLPGMDGLDVLKKLNSSNPDIPVVMISGHGNIETAVKATKLGAYDFLEKPLSMDKLLLTISRALEHHKLSVENRSLRQRMIKPEDVIGNCDKINDLRDQVSRVAPTDGWILITGENGTGKELVARSIHVNSKRKDKPFVDVNCAAIPEELIESELFGHEKGAFTGATESKKGKFQLANGGTIFLDEIADMSLKTQAKILRILQEQKFERVGGSELINVDVRVIAATNKNLEELMAKGEFRDDLFYRLNVVPLFVPPLRERKEDIPLFIDHFLTGFCNKTTTRKKRLTSEAVTAMVGYSWPGNVREIKNVIERLVIMTLKQEITLKDLPSIITGEEPRNTEEALNLPSLRKARAAFEKEFIVRKLKEFNFNVKRTATAIGLERSSLHRKLKSYGINGRTSGDV